MASSAEPAGCRPDLVYLVRSWPRLSQTFVLDEVLGMQRLGAPVRVVSLTHGDVDGPVQSGTGRLASAVTFLDGAQPFRRQLLAHLRTLRAAPRGYLRALGYAVRRRRVVDAGYRAASLLQCFALAVRLVDMLRAGRGPSHAVSPGGCHLHAHFAHDPAAVAHLAHLVTGMPWSLTAHARDLWQVPAGPLADRVASARFAVTCCRDGEQRLLRVLPAELRPKVRLVYHGVDVEALAPAAGPRDPGPARLVTVGRLVEKKGITDLVDACHLLVAEGRDLRCAVFGGGPLAAELADQVERLGLGEVVRLHGDRTRDDLLPELRSADAFVLTPFVTPTGDRDGVPNALLEAMACARPILATAVGGVGEAVTSGVDGLLVPARDVPAIAAGLASLLDDPDLAARLGSAARRTVVSRFDARAAVARLAEMFEPTLGWQPPLADRPAVTR